MGRIVAIPPGLGITRREWSGRSNGRGGRGAPDRWGGEAAAGTLATLHRTGPRRITDLAVIEGVTQPAMTVLVRVMEESGLVERRGDASDKRVTLVGLTEAGASYVRTRRQAGVDALARLIDELADDEVEALLAALPALAHLAELEDRDREGPKR
jgi:DNA-binding MarR family transcriptional regulator